MFSAALLCALTLAQTAPAAAAPAAAAPAAAAPPGERAAAAAEADPKAADTAQTASEAAQRADESSAKFPKTPAKPAAVAEAPSPWTATVGLGLISLTGNTSSVSVAANANAERKSEDWIFALKMGGTYGQSRAQADAESKVLALNAFAQLRGDRRFTNRVSGYLLTGTDTDHVKSVEYRSYGEVGVGLIWFDDKRADGSQSFLRTDLGFRAAKESRFQYYPVPLKVGDKNLAAPRLGLEFRQGITKDLLFVQQAEVLENVVGDSRTLVNTLSKLSVRLVRSLAIGASFAVGYDSQPAPGKVPTDTTLALSLDYSI
jgi:putative salt-induced outer membrane protein YdiY